MSSFDSLREEIRDVFHIFDEDESGSISIPEVIRALYTVTGERVSRSDVLKLVASAREAVSKRHADELKKSMMRLAAAAAAAGTGGGGDQNPTPSPREERGGGAQEAETSAVRQASSHDNGDGVDIEVFEQVVFRKLNARSYEEELAFTFALLEDKYYPGFITKDSMKRAAAETDETLTEAEVDEMFDALVTGVPSAAVDFTTFVALQNAARKLEDHA